MGSLIRSFKFAWQGIVYCFATQRNLKIHAVAAVLALGVAWRIGVTAAELAVLALTIAGVLVAEMFNTAVETVVNMISPDYHPLAKIAKDVAAGAVLVTALTSLAVAYLVFGQRFFGLGGLS